MQTNAARTWYEDTLEWVVAAVLMLALTGGASLLLRGARTVDPVTPVIAREPPGGAPAPAAVPSGAVSVPLLLLDDGREVRVGDSLTGVVAHLGPAAQMGIQTVEPATHGERVIRFYQRGGIRFVLVFEPFASAAEARVAAIFLR